MIVQWRLVGLLTLLYLLELLGTRPALWLGSRSRGAAPAWPTAAGARMAAHRPAAPARPRQATRQIELAQAAIWLTYLALITAAELAVALVSPYVGAGLHFLLLFALPMHASFAPPRCQPLLLALVVAPLVRLVSLAMPLIGLPMELWWVLTSAPLFIAAIPLIRELGLTRDSLALRIGHLPTQLGIALIGLPLALGEYLILHPAAVAGELSPSEMVAPTLALLVSTGFLEELLFRGLLQAVAFKLLGAWGLVYVSAVFAVLHIGYLSVVDVVFVFVVGLLFAQLVARTRSLLGVTLAHGITNTGLYVVLPHLLPGVSLASLIGW